MQKKCFVISWYFPPINSSEGLCTYKLLKNSKYKYDVYTQGCNLEWTYGNNAMFDIPNNINVIRSSKNDKKQWEDEVYKYYLNNYDKYDVIMSRSNEPEAHDIALKIKKRFPNIVWIASFGDPISTNPYNNLYKKKSPYSIRGNDVFRQSIFKILSPKRILKNIWWNYKNKKYIIIKTRYYKNIKTEKNTILYADKLIFNNEYQMNHMINNYSNDIKEKCYIIPHSYDLSFYNRTSNKLNKTSFINMAYLGHFDNDRTPIQILKAIYKLKNNNPGLYKKLKLNIYGDMSDNDKIYILEHQLFDCVSFHNPVDYFTSLKIMCESDILLSVDANLAKYIDNNIFYAAKIADYLGANKPIFCVTMQNGISSDIVRNAGGIVSSYSENEIYLLLVSILDGSYKFNINTKYIEDYNIKNIIKKFDNIIRNER